MRIIITSLQRLQQVSLTAVLLTLLLTATASAALVNRKISGVMPAFGDAEYSQISPDGQYGVYIADQDADEVYELYSVPLDGSGPQVKLNGSLVSGSDIFDYKISPDSSRVVYRADQEMDDVFELYSVPLGGGPVVKLNGILVGNGDVAQYSLRISPDSGRVVYIADQETDDIFELFVTYEQPPILNFSAATATVSEETGAATALVQLNETLTTTVQVDYAVTGGTATGGGVDYTLTGGTLLFAPGVITQPVELSLTDDAEQEANETVVISLSNPDNAVLGPSTVFTLTLTDNDSPGELPAFPIYLPLVIRE